MNRYTYVNIYGETKQNVTLNDIASILSIKQFQQVKNLKLGEHIQLQHGNGFVSNATRTN